MRRRLFALLICITVSLNLLWAFPAWGAADYSTIRVALSSLGTPESVSLVVHGPYRIAGKDIPLTDGAQYTILRQGDKLSLSSGDTCIDLGKGAMIEGLDDAFSTYLEVCNTAYGWRQYLGSMEARVEGNGLCLINHIYLERYLYGVIPYEMSILWPLEALKSQAVTARTYAVRCVNPAAHYDLGDTGSSQIYKGYDAGKTNCIQAVDETAGQVVAWQETFAGTYYTPSNGGWIESAYNRWGSELPYSEVKEDPYDARNQQNPHRVWEVAYNRLSVDPALESRLLPCIQSDLRARGYSDAAEDIDIQQIKSMNTDDPDSSGRHASVSLLLMVQAKKTRNGSLETVEQPVELSGNAIMNVLDIKSLLFSLTTTDERCVLTGAGNGHGIGMSQYGARQMADEGKSCADILSFYYPGTEIMMLSLNPPSPSAEEGDAAVSDPAPSPDAGETGAEEDMYGTVNVSTSLNVRQGPGLQYQQVGELSNAARVRILIDQGEWTQIQAGDLTGYVYTAYVTPDTPVQQNPTPEPTEQEPPPSEDPALPPDKNRHRGVVTASILYVRSGPSTKNHQLGLCVRGDGVDIMGRQGGWYQILFADTQGYVYSQYIRIVEEGEDIGPIGDGFITAEWLNVRTGPGIQYGRTAQLQRGDRVEIVAGAGDWYQVRFDGGTGYVYAGYVRQASETQRGGSIGAVAAAIAAPRVNIRSGPSLSSQRVATFTEGTTVEILGAEGGWYFFEYQGARAYVHASLVHITGYKTAKVSPNTLNIRTGPGNRYPAAGQLSQGATVIILSQEGDWTLIMQGDGVGYVYSAYLTRLR